MKRILLLTVVLAFGQFVVAGNSVAKVVLTTLFTFNGTNGALPYGQIVQGSDSNFYGTTAGGGTNDFGTVFKITPSGTLTTLHSFIGSDGRLAYGGLVEGIDGNFYGTTMNGGTFSNGTVFVITPSGMLTTLYSFQGTSADGLHPICSLVQGSDTNFYGTTNGGSTNRGTVFRISPGGSFSNLYTFSGPDGNTPVAGLVLGEDGNFYGTTSGGGTNNDGTVFMITSSGTLTTLHRFIGTDGSNPTAPLVLATDGNFYGTTQEGGAKSEGTVFRMTTAGTLTTLYSFKGKSDGGAPLGGLIQASDGNLYGMTLFGGTKDNGVVYEVILGTKIKIKKVLVFKGAKGTKGNTERIPAAGLVQGSDGNFYGATQAGGPSIDDDGTIFKLNTGL
jgi:uncharacterized repeat protein (TIGR03803 family)